MSELNLRRLEERLLEERDQTLRSIRAAESEESEGQRESTGDLSRTPIHMADAGSDTQEAEKDFANITRESGQLAAIDEALLLLRRRPEAYQRCERCEAEIEPERLDTIPWTRLCAACATGPGAEAI
jgi:RNA polymerase-binding transcription factor DksA